MLSVLPLLCSFGTTYIHISSCYSDGCYLLLNYVVPFNCFMRLITFMTIKGMSLTRMRTKYIMCCMSCDQNTFVHLL